MNDRPRVANGAGRERRRRAFERYADVLARQLAALEGGDLDSMAALADERDAIAGELDAATTPAPDAAEPSARHDAEAISLDAALRLTLERCATLDESLRERLRELRGETAADLEKLGSRRGGARRYLDPGVGATRVDVRL